jgi:hypothetical protein
MVALSGKRLGVGVAAMASIFPTMRITLVGYDSQPQESLSQIRVCETTVREE